MNESLNSWARAFGAGVTGAVTVTAIHQLARQVTGSAPRMDLVGERALAGTLHAAGLDVPPEPQLYRWTLAGDLISNSAYYALVACGPRRGIWSRAVVYGLAAGIGALVLPRRMGLGDPPKSDRASNQVMTVAWYLAGALAAAGAATLGQPWARPGSATGQAGVSHGPGPGQARARPGSDTRQPRDLSREKNAVVPETESGTTKARDFGKSDRYANKDGGQDFNVRTTGDGTAWDSGRESSIAQGTAVETDTRVADVETPGVSTRPAAPPIEPETH